MLPVMIEISETVATGTSLCQVGLVCVDNLKSSLALMKSYSTRIWANAQRDGRPAEYSWHALFNAAKFG